MKRQDGSGFQLDINGLRGINVLLVLLYHFNVRFFSGGFVGVDVFFVISGYLMTKIIVSGLLDNRFSYLDFVLKRAVRIWPALLCLVLTLLAAGSVLLAPSDLDDLARQSLHALLFDSNYYFAGRQGYFSAGADNNWLLHTWSLSVEWQFYMLYPLLLWSAFGAGKRRLGSIYVVLIAVLAASLTYCIVQDSQGAFFSLFARAWQMIAGGLVYLVGLRRTPSLGYRRFLSYAGTAIVALSVSAVAELNLSLVWPGPFAVLPVAGACLVLLGGYQKNPFLANRWIQAVGKWSYSIYLWHMPFVIAFAITGQLAERPRVSATVGIVVSVCLGFLSYKFVEPANFLKRVSRHQAYLRLVSIAAGLVLATQLIIGSDGLLFRVHDRPFFMNLARAEASKDRQAECQNLGTEVDRVCRLNGNRGGKKVLVLGDSHAGHLYPWFAKYSRVNTTFYVKPGCPLIADFERVGLAMHCREYSARAFAMADSGEYQTVIISQNWAGFTDRSRDICWYHDGSCVPLRDSGDPMSVFGHMRDSLETMLSKNVSVVVLDGTPWFKVDVSRALAREMFWSGKATYSYDEKFFFDADAEYEKLFETLKRHKNFTLLSFLPRLCNGTVCSVFDAGQNMPIFKDHDHFNPDWLLNNGAMFAQFVSP